MKKIIFVFAILLIISCNSRHRLILEIKPPIKEISIQGSMITIDPSIKQLVRLNNGLSIEVPEAAFVDSQGKTITEPVTLSIKAYNTVAEIIVSGIPMLYREGNSTSNFESAGMFEISGKAGNSEVFIKDGKGLMINYPSRVEGDFDFFYFNKTRDDTVVTGSWEKLSYLEQADIPTKKILDEFNLKFAVDDYPELAPLSAISWKLASKYGNPLEDKNKWVLETPWSSIEISQPIYGFGDVLFSDSVNYHQGYIDAEAIIVSGDGNRIFTTCNEVTKIWTKEGRLVKTIDKVKDDFDPIEILNDKYIVIKREEGDCIYNLDGVKIGLIPESQHRSLAKSKDVILFQKRGIEPTVYIYSVPSKQTKKIELKEDESNFWNAGIYESYILTPSDELITNSSDGICIYNLNGQLVKQRKGHYADITYAKESTLIIGELDGRLTRWNYKNNEEIKSIRSDFDLKNKLIENTCYSSYYFVIPNAPYFVINEPRAENSEIWNYELNTTINLDFVVATSGIDSLPANLIVGYNYNTKSFHLYDVLKQKEIIQIPNFQPSIISDYSGYQALVSPNKKQLLLNGISHVLFYNLTGKLICDFKKFDSLICTSGFINNDLIYTVSEDGIYRTWNKEGVELSSKKLKNEEYIEAYFYDNKLVTWNRTFSKVQLYNLNGELLFDPGRSRISEILDSNLILHHYDKKPVILSRLFKVEPFIYQVLLTKADQEFVTYVYLDNSDLQKINAYYTFRKKKLIEENNRLDKEYSTIRRFQINKFGIYNWDVLRKQDDCIQLTANFKFDIPTDYNNISIFLITDINGSAVIRYSKEQWDNFNFDPNLPNKLLAILPGDKTAVFSNADFRALDINTIKKDKAYTFKMKIINEPLKSLADLEDKLK